MDMTNFTAIGSSLGIVSLVVSIFTFFNHKRVRSSCCGKDLEASIDVENTTPVQLKKPLLIKTPSGEFGGDECTPVGRVQ